MGMKRTAITAVLVLGLTACVGTEVRDETPGLAGGTIPSAIRTQTYVPGGSAARAEGAQPMTRTERAQAEPPAPVQRPDTPPSRPRRGRSSPPPSDLYTSPPVTAQPSPSLDRAVDDLKRDQARSDLDRMRNDPTTLTPEPWRQRELMNRQLELDRRDIMRR